MRQHRRMSSPPLRPTVIQIRRLRQLWRSAGWPCQDMLEVELLAPKAATAPAPRADGLQASPSKS